MTRDHLVEAMAKAYVYDGAVFQHSTIDEVWEVLPDRDEICRSMSAALSALESLGIALVPVEPAMKMMDEFLDHGFKGDDYGHGLRPWNLRAGYAAMLSASPLRKTEGA